VSGPHGAAYTGDDIAFLRLIGRVVAFPIDDNSYLRQAEAVRAELQRQNEKLQGSERDLRGVIETIPTKLDNSPGLQLLLQYLMPFVLPVRGANDQFLDSIIFRTRLKVAAPQLLRARQPPVELRYCCIGDKRTRAGQYAHSRKGSFRE